MVDRDAVLLAIDLELDRRLTPAQKLAQALDMMAMGIRLKHSTLRLRFPDAAEHEIQQMLTSWLTEDG